MQCAYLQMARDLQQCSCALLELLVACSFLVFVTAGELRECREQEYKDQSGMCVACKQCDAGQELSKECGFGYGEDARCMPCRPNRFKESRGPQKCKSCLNCALVNRFQKANCSGTSNAVCGDCVPGFYRKTKLSGFQDMECVPCGDPPPPYEVHCSSRVNLVPLPSSTTSPRDVALAAVICSALAAVLLALLILCVIYCKRQLMEKKPSASSSSSSPQGRPYTEAELSCFDCRRAHEVPRSACCRCHQTPGQACGPVHLIPSLCCDETCSIDHSRETSPFPSYSNLSDGHPNHLESRVPLYLGSLSDSTESWPLMGNLDSAGNFDQSQCALESKEEAEAEEPSKVHDLQLGVHHSAEDCSHQHSGGPVDHTSWAEPPEASSV